MYKKKEKLLFRLCFPRFFGGWVGRMLEILAFQHSRKRLFFCGKKEVLRVPVKNERVFLDLTDLSLRQA